jgi:PPM family protein phosphatase
MPEFVTRDGTITYGAYSHEGRCATQEDRYVVTGFQTADGLQATLALVADGIGGRQSGEMASHLAEMMIPAYVQNHVPAASEISATLVAALHEANARIFEAAQQDIRRAGMGTTCTVVVLVGSRLHLAHVGDSRLYVVRRSRIQQLSIDHTWAEEALKAGRSPEEIRTHPNRGVIKRYLGIDPDVLVDTRYRPLGTSYQDTPVDSSSHPFFLERGDTVMLCTDGLPDVVEDVRILDVVRRATAPNAARNLVEQALKVGAEDNITAVVLDMPGARKGLVSPLSLVWAAASIAVIAIIVGLVALISGRPLYSAPMLPSKSISGGEPEVSVTMSARPTRTKSIATKVTVDIELPVDVATAVIEETLEPTSTPLPTDDVPSTATPHPTDVSVAETTSPPVTPIPTSVRHTAPTLLEPSNDQWIENTNIAHLHWSLDEGLAAGESFRVQIWRDGNLVNQYNGTGFAYDYQLPGYGRYKWQVVVLQGDVFVSEPSVERSFGYAAKSSGGGGGGGGTPIGPTPGKH